MSCRDIAQHNVTSRTLTQSEPICRDFLNMGKRQKTVDSPVLLPCKVQLLIILIFLFDAHL